MGSDHMILNWASKSGLWKPKKNDSTQSSKDRPGMNFHVRELDDLSMRRAVLMAAPLQPRHYVVMEVRGNLLKEDRSETLARFRAAQFKRIAHIVVGEPNLEFKKKTQQLILQDKQEASDKAFALKKLEEKRKRQFEKRQKEIAKAKKKADKLKAKREKELQKKK